MTTSFLEVSAGVSISAILNSILKSAPRSTSRPEVIKVPYQVGLGHFDSTEVTIPGITIDPIVIYVRYEKELRQIYNTGINLGETIFYQAERDPFQVSFLEAVCDTCSLIWRRAHVISRYLEVVSKEEVPVEQVLEAETRQNAEYVEQWLLSESKSSELTIGISPQIGFPADTVMDRWRTRTIPFVDAALQPCRIFQFEGAEFSKVFHEDSFVLPLENGRVDSDIADQIEEFRLSICLSCKQPVEVVSATIRPSIWENAPGKRPNFNWHIPGSQRTPDVASGIQFWASAGRENDEAVPTFWSGIKSHHIELQRKWHQYLRDNQECQFGLSVAMDGAFLILQSMSEPVFRRSTMALRGIHLVLCGMEGIGGALGSSEGDNSTRFKNYWEPIWFRASEKSLEKSHLKRTNNIRSSLGQLYKLRNSLAHANRQSLNFEIMCSKRALGDFFNQGDWSSYSFGFCLVQIAFELFDELGN